TNDARRYAVACEEFNEAPLEPFDGYMGGISSRSFFNSYPYFTETNDLSLVTFINYAGFQILFPGDLEKAGWQALLLRPEFCSELMRTSILVASHHGRENGFCEDVFNYLKPQPVCSRGTMACWATRFLFLL
ncbi:MAG TPA: hypothetical protein VK663_02690, partial [Burkholderiales bacterium]|nr:hypothetical protein [Burkholderiales bacterium]